MIPNCGHEWLSCSGFNNKVRVHVIGCIQTFQLFVAYFKTIVASLSISIDQFGMTWQAVQP
jgi:hypothetical protein